VTGRTDEIQDGCPGLILLDQKTQVPAGLEQQLFGRRVDGQQTLRAAERGQN